MSDKKRKLKSIGRVILLLVISLIIGIRLYSFNAQTLAGNAMPMPFGYGVSVVLSGSMEPTLSVNDLVIVNEQSDYEVDDIVVYQDGNMLVIHRIISTDEDEVITKGDANNVADEPISASDIKGKAIAHIPFVGALVRFLKTPVGFILIIAAAILLLELPNLRERKKAMEEQEKIKEEIKRLKGE
ncbi:MAG: signal peptidase I [Eubacterium sp.]|nr:signal peptidase I [Eubacterium sp.]